MSSFVFTSGREKLQSRADDVVFATNYALAAGAVLPGEFTTTRVVGFNREGARAMERRLVAEGRLPWAGELSWPFPTWAVRTRPFDREID